MLAGAPAKSPAPRAELPQPTSRTDRNLEGWTVPESIYFSFVTGLTIGYGDLAPKTLMTRTLAILIGACGILLTALIAAVAVKALAVAQGDPSRPHDDDELT